MAYVQLLDEYVKYYEYEHTTLGVAKPGRGGAKFVRSLKGEAIFHQFGVDYEEFESGPGNFSTAIIELPDGTVKNVPVENIEFK